MNIWFLRQMSVWGGLYQIFKKSKVKYTSMSVFALFFEVSVKADSAVLGCPAGEKQNLKLF